MARLDTLTAAQIIEAVQEVWNLDGAEFGPVPLIDLRCPVCASRFWMVQYWRYHERGIRVPYRCDVGFKCLRCSALWLHGVAIPEWYWRRYATRVGSRVYWREAARIHERKPNRWQ